ncbi:MAG: hypothetical protein KGH68_03785, partial [Patescibacteria group bacterium]|nr:hypothetical protein [Patescibacteria group bacterium]
MKAQKIKQKDTVDFYIDESQAKKVFGLLLERLARKGPPYNTAHVPQADMFLPTNLNKKTREHATFLFVLCLWMRGGVESDTAAAFLGDMYQEEPELFVPESYVHGDKEQTEAQISMVKDALRRYRLDQRVDENACGWVYNMRKLARFWGGDPRRFMDDRPDFGTLVRRIKSRRADRKSFLGEHDREGFMYFREKMVAMLAYFLMDADLVPMFYAPVPVDFHVLRVLIASEVIRVRGKSTEETIGVDFMRTTVLQLAREATEGYCRSHRVSPIALADSLWLLSRTLCRRNPGNSGYVTDSRKDPNWKGRRRFHGPKWSVEELAMPGKVESFRRSCGLCPLNGSNGTCAFNVVSGAYYVAGQLRPERLRFVPTELQAHFLDHPEFQGTEHHLIDETVRFAPIPFDDQGQEA